MFFVDNESLILKQLEDLGDEFKEVGKQVNQVDKTLTRIEAYQRTHYEKLGNHEDRLHSAETKLQDLEIKTSGNKLLMGVAGFFAGACVIGAINYLFTTVIA